MASQDSHVHGGKNYVKLTSPEKQKQIINLINKTLPLPSLSQRVYNNANSTRLPEVTPSPPSSDTRRRAAGKISNLFSHETTTGLGDCDYDKNSTDMGKKLKIRGLKNYIEKRGCGIPPSWVKDFPCRSKYHPDSYLYDLEDGPSSPKRNVEAMSQCTFHGGRCRICGVYTSNLCPSCSHCESDCACSNPSHQNNPSSSANSMRNPLHGFPSLDSIGTTLSKAHRILQSSQNAPAQYPFTLSPPIQENQKHFQNSPPIQMQQPLHQGPFSQSYPYPYPYMYPPLPYMMPPPPAYGYPHPLLPMPMGYPQPQHPPMAPSSSFPSFGFPYTQTIPPTQSHGPYFQNSSQPTCRSYISVNNSDTKLKK